MLDEEPDAHHEGRLDPLGGLYQPIGGRDARARGLVLDDADPGLRTVRTDRHPRESFDAIVDGVLEDVLAAAAELRAAIARAADTRRVDRST
ncbi:MAG: hypothetical protein KY442_07490 [Proteobacteria bacterium]|nr:hypothetical protein [Pseudomonadota bacterium]